MKQSAVGLYCCKYNIQIYIYIHSAAVIWMYLYAQKYVWHTEVCITYIPLLLLLLLKYKCVSGSLVGTAAAVYTYDLSFSFCVFRSKEKSQ